MKLNNFIKTVKPILIKYEPEMLVGFGIGGLIFSTMWGIKASFKAAKRLENKKKELNKEKLTFKEGLKEVWPLYIPVVISIGLAVPSIIISNRISARRNTALAAAYMISETAFNEYKDQTKELFGSKKEQEIHEKISEKKIKNSYKKNDILITGDGDHLFYESISGRYFMSNWNKILRSANELNAKAITSAFLNTVTLGDWYDELGIPETDISESLGWTLEDGKEGLISIFIDSSLTPDNKPCGSIGYHTLPKSIV